jgi:hypothetical protein
MMKSAILLLRMRYQRLSGGIGRGIARGDLPSCAALGRSSPSGQSGVGVEAEISLLKAPSAVLVIKAKGLEPAV